MSNRGTREALGNEGKYERMNESENERKKKGKWGTEKMERPKRNQKI